MRIAICICTYRRPDGLRNLLGHLSELNTRYTLIVIVADNDQRYHQGLDLVNKLTDYRWPIHGILVCTNGISYARNGAINKAIELKPDLIACLDDDEWPSPNWLEELVSVQQRYQADVVGGPTLSVFPEEVSIDQRENPYFGADLNLKNGSSCQLQAAGNFLITAAALQDMAPNYFHPEFALSGGEDLAFFTTLGKKGRQMRWAAKAIAYETVPAERLTTAWLRQRVINIANSRVFVMKSLEPELSYAAIRVFKTTVLGCVALAISTVGIIFPNFARKGALLRWKFTGKMMAHLRRRTVRSETKAS